jgi:ubiquitin C-terminal hydrolase
MEKYNNNIPIVGFLNFSKSVINKFNLNNDNSNLYNICYMNASMQCLFRIDEFVDKILAFDGKNLSGATKELIYKMINKEPNLSVYNIKSIMGEYNDIYKENNPEDAHEFIINYLNILLKETFDETKISKLMYENYDDQDLKKFFNKFYKISIGKNIKNGSSFIFDLFYGILKTYKCCKNCQSSNSVKLNSFNVLEMPGYSKKKKTLNIKDIFKEFLSEKETNLTCDKCNSRLISKTDIYNLPKCLIIYFGYNNYGYEYKKNNIQISLQFNYKNNNYILKGIIYHRAFGKSGHFSASCYVNDDWYYFDDNYVNEERKSYIIGKPIILFYEKKN